MAAETSVKPVATNGFDDDDDDDDKPIVFRRNGSAGSTSSLKQSATAQKTKVVTSTNSPNKPPLANPRPSASPDDQSRESSLPAVTNGFDDDDDDDHKPIVFRRNGSAGSSSDLKHSATGQKTKVVMSTNSPKKSSLANPRPSASPDDQSRKSSLSVVKKENQTPKNVSQPKIKDEDSDDDKPLSSRFKVNKDPGSVGPGVSPPMHSSKPSSENPNKSIKAEDSDDETPISSRLQLKNKVRTPVSNPDEIEDKKPLASKAHQNGLVKNEMRSSQLSGKRPADRPNLVSSSKRPLEKGNSFDQSSGKKPKLLGSCTTVKTAKSNKKEASDDDDENLTIANRRKTGASKAKSSSTKRKTAKAVSKSSKKIIKKSQKAMKNAKYSKSSSMLPSGDGQKKWTTLVHNGVIFPPPYKPHGVKILYKGKQVDLTPAQEEVATMFAVMKETDYYSKPTFRENFWNDWSQLLGKKHLIQDLENCNFDPIYEWHLQEKEKKKQMSTDEKKALKEEKLKQEEKYMWAVVDGVKEKVGNFRVEPPGLFRGRGEHPKMGKLKKRIHPSDITINIGKGAPIPECPVPGESWKEVRHDNTVTWLAYWYDPINTKEFKYVFLAASSALKGQSDKEKYEKARKLKDYIKNIRAAYTKNFTSKDIMKQQIAVATYLIDKLALRAGNEKDDDEAETVGCCTLKVGNVECIPPNKLKFDFLGKDSIQYVNTVEVEPPVYKAIGQFQSKKAKTDDLFDQLDTSKLNAHLKELMPGLTAKVFRTYNASITLDEMLSAETKDGDVTQKVVVYQLANKEVAIICNHQRTVSKTHGAQIERLTLKMEELKGVIKELKTDLDRARKGKPPLKDSDGKQKRNLAPEALEKKIAQTNAKIEKIERDINSKEDLKTVALGTSKINYMDPRISVAWCKRHEVPIEKIFNKSLLAKFAWAMDVDPEFRF